MKGLLENKLKAFQKYIRIFINNYSIQAGKQIRQYLFHVLTVFDAYSCLLVSIALFPLGKGLKNKLQRKKKKKSELAREVQ